MRCHFLSLASALLSITLLAACEGPAGPAGAKGADGENGVDGTNGTNGTNGVDGRDGIDGRDGVDGENGYEAEHPSVEPDSLDIVVTDVTIDGPPVVTFTVSNEHGEPYNQLDQGLLEDRLMRFTIAKLVPGTNGERDAWQNYINTTESTSSSTAGPDGVPVLSSAIHATTEGSGTLEYLGDGVYTYTFSTDITAITSPITVEYEEDLLHRLAIQLEYPVDDEELIYNITHDWVPSGATAPVTRYIVSTESCNECHGELELHGGGRQDVDYCVTCHNPGTTDANSGESMDLPVMVHKIHMGHNLPSVAAGEELAIWGYRDSKHDYSHVGYPQDPLNCIKCHDPADADTPDAINYLEKPTRESCGSCHDDIDFNTGEGHLAGSQTNQVCFMCHTSTSIEEDHLTENATPHNPSLPAGLSDITYELLSATVDSAGTLTVDFKVYRDGVALDATNRPSDLTGGPSFLLPYALAQDGMDAPADYNNLGKTAAQPATLSVSSVVAGTVSGASISHSGGVNTITYASAFPEGATLRAVALQGYYSQTLSGTSYGRHAVSVQMPIAGDDVRREVVDPENCASCHEYFEGHGGNRVYETQVCVMCHVPNLSSSGRELNLDHPEASQNFKDLIHGIHGAAKREYPLDFVRNRSGGTRYTFLGREEQLSEYPDGHLVTYPNNPAKCTTCHIEGTYLPEEMPSFLLTTAERIGAAAATTADVTAARRSVPNSADWVISPYTSSCSSCHNSDAAQAHMEHNGGAVVWDRSEVTEEEPFEACVVCHGDGQSADIRAVHGVE